MYRTRQIRIRKGHRLYGYLHQLSERAAKLYNRGNYLVRQYATSMERIANGIPLTENQEEAYRLVRSVTEGTKYFPKGRWLNYNQLDYILKRTADPAYCALPAQANQQILRMLLRNYKAFFESLKQYQKFPEKFRGCPRMPGYRKQGSLITAVLTNQICRIRETHYLKFPGTKDKVNIGKTGTDIKLKEVRIRPQTDSFVLEVVLELPEPEVSGDQVLCGTDEQVLRERFAGMTDSSAIRAAAIDPGTDNLCAVTNNFGERPFLIRGGILKSENRYYNKKLAEYRSEAKRCNDRYFTKRIGRLHERRDRIIRDQLHKISRRIAEWAAEHRVQVVIMGHNVWQKQEIRLGSVNNQNFVQLPFRVLAGMLRYKLEEKGIVFLETEEAYTSQADFLAMDPIPAYRKGKERPEMSGKRIHRGLYRHGNGQFSNADINGAANILRKVFPNINEWDRGVVDTPYAVRYA